MNKSKKEIAGELEGFANEARELAEDLGLSPKEVKYWIVDNEEMDELIAYGGFQTRYPHWRWGMEYEQQRAKSQLGLGKAFEIVNNDDPAHAFLQKSNSMADQKAVITHVEAHADFFENNQYFPDDPNAAEMLEKHAERIEQYVREHGRERVEKFIDTVTCIQDHIDQHSGFAGSGDNDTSTLQDRVDSLRVSEAAKDVVFDDEWIEEHEEEDGVDVEEDLLLFLLKNGGTYDEDSGKTVEYEEWQSEILRMLRKEFYYFAPQRMTKVMNEGWAAFWEGVMMADENLAGENEFIKYSNHQSMVLASGGLNPYSLGLALWRFVEKQADRSEVLDKLLRVEGITVDNFNERVDFSEVESILSHPESPELTKRHYSLVRPENRGFLQNTPRSVLKEEVRYIMDTDRYSTVEEALEDVDYDAGWERMREVRETHNDVMFLDEFITPEFIKKGEYWTYEYCPDTDDFRIASQDPEDVKKKLLLQFTNFGKPEIRGVDSNYKNRNQMLFEHNFNGIMLDIGEAKKVLKRLYDICGCTVNLKTIVNTTGEVQKARMLTYDGSSDVVEKSIPWSDVEHLAEDTMDYDTSPDDW